MATQGLNQDAGEVKESTLSCLVLTERTGQASVKLDGGGGGRPGRELEANGETAAWDGRDGEG